MEALTQPGLENDFQGPSQVLQGLVEMARHSFRCLLLGQPRCWSNNLGQKSDSQLNDCHTNQEFE